MIDLTQYTSQQILQQLLDRVPDTFDKRDTSPIPTAAGMAAYGLEQYYINLAVVQREGLIQFQFSPPRGGRLHIRTKAKHSLCIT